MGVVVGQARQTALFFYQAYQEAIGFCSWTHKLCRLRSRIDDGLAEEQEAGLLVLDDLGTERTTHWELAMLHLLVDGRATLPTIVTSNWSLAQCEGVLANSAKRDDHRAAVATLSEKIIDRL